MEKNQKHFTRQEISPGIILEKFQELVHKKKYYVMRIDLELFNELDFCVDFTGSTKVKLEGADGLVCKTKVAPLTKVEVARLSLERGWVMKTKFRCFLELPSLEAQRAKLEPYRFEIERQIDATRSLAHLNIPAVDDRYVLEFLSDKGCGYVDHEFLPYERSIHKDPEYVINNLKCIADWRRFKLLQKAIRETRKGSKVGDLSSQRINPNDIQQGKLADSWLLSAIAALAYEPKLVQRLILTKVHNDTGFVKVKLWDMSKWVMIALDDYFPCYPLGDTIFSQVENGKMWPLVLEKAFAKKYGSYTKLEDGNPKTAFIDLTNCPTFNYKIADPIMQRWIINYEFFARIYEWKRVGYAITVTTKSTIPQQDIGILIDHSYTLVTLYPKEQLIQLRDPLKVTKFAGKYCQDSPLWTDSLKSTIKPVFINNYIYVSCDEFIDILDSITVCKLNRWSELSCKGKFVNVVEVEDENVSHFSSRWSYKFTTEKSQKVTIGVHQADDKCPGVRETSPYTDIGIYVLNAVKGAYNLLVYDDPRFNRDVYVEARLDKGTYYIVPKSSGLKLIDTLCANICSDIDIDIDGPAFSAIINETFEKLDILDQGRITKQELDTFYSFLKRNITVNEVHEILQPYYSEFKFVDNETYDKKAFAILFKETYMEYNDKSKKEFFDLLGYNADCLSVRSRVFGLTIHSQEPIEVSTEDALKNGIDQTTLRLILKNHGLHAKTGEKLNLTVNEVVGCYYYNV